MEQAGLSGSETSYRDRIYIVKDLILKLVEHNELNQTALVSFCGLNLKKHKPIIDDLESNEFISRSEIHHRKKTIVIYRPTQKGIEFCTNILQPYENIFPRKGVRRVDSKTSDIDKHEDETHQKV
jgi:predicted transcriptional regulator